MRIVAYQTVGDWTMTRPVFGPYADRLSAPFGLEQLRHPRVLVRRVVALGELAAQAVALGGQVLDLALRRQRVPEPAEQVAHRLQRAARTLLHRVEDLARTALHIVQGAAPGFSEIGSEQDQGADDEQPEDCPAPPDRLVVHEGDGSKALVSVNSAARL